MIRSIAYLSLVTITIFYADCNTATKVDSYSRTNVRVDSLWNYHFNALDSAVRANPKDTVYYCCTTDIQFMEVRTKIEAKSDGTLFGKLSFSKDIWKQWHQWYKKNYLKKYNGSVIN